MTARATVGDRLWLTDVQTARSGVDPDGAAEIVSAAVTVQRVDRMHCGCDRLRVERPFSEGGWSPTVALFAPGCDLITCGEDRIDVSAARAELERVDARDQVALFEVAS